MDVLLFHYSLVSFRLQFNFYNNFFERMCWQISNRTPIFATELPSKKIISYQQITHGVESVTNSVENLFVTVNCDTLVVNNDTRVVNCDSWAVNVPFVFQASNYSMGHLWENVAVNCDTLIVNSNMQDRELRFLGSE